MTLEVIAKNINDILEINKSNADRIELCSNLEVGGLTPELDFIKQACEKSKKPVNVMVRYTHSNFIFTKDELNKQLDSIKWISENTKANGVVIGAINEDKTINEDFLKKLNGIKNNLEITFHKAFDEVNDFVESYKILEKYGVKNVLTSGGPNINKGFVILNKMATLKGNVNILIGGGVTTDNINECLKYSDNIHIGTHARKNKNWDSDISIDNINNVKNIMINN